jgi:hypothetical protein
VGRRFVLASPSHSQLFAKAFKLFAKSRDFGFEFRYSTGDGIGHVSTLGRHG